jgi:DnaK suppressor protein
MRGRACGASCENRPAAHPAAFLRRREMAKKRSAPSVKKAAPKRRAVKKSPAKRTTAVKPTSRWLPEQRERLEKERDSLRRQIESETRLLGVQGTSDPREDADIAEEDREDQEAAETVEALQQKFHQVEEALRRISRGNYGICADCRRPILRDRLIAIPWAVRCTACQSAFERKKKA